MAAIFNSPSKYIQGPDELAKLGSYVEPLGAKALVIVTPSGKKRVGAKIEGGFAEAKAELLFEDFNGECSKGEVCLLYTSPSPRDRSVSRMPSSA